MKKLILFFLLTVLSGHLKAQGIQKDISREEASVLLTREDLMYGYLPAQETTSPSGKQPFTSIKEIEAFLGKIVEEKELTPDVKMWLTQNLTTYNNGAAIIFVRHPLNLTKMYNTAATGIQNNFKEICTAKIDVDKGLILYKAEEKKLKDEMERTDKMRSDLKADKIDDKKQVSSFKQLNKVFQVALEKQAKLRPLLESVVKESTQLATSLAELQNKYTESLNYLVEDTTNIDVTVIAKENGLSSDYLLNKKNIMVVFLGSSFKRYGLQLLNGKKRAAVELGDLIKVAKAVTTPVSPSNFTNSGSTCPLKDFESQLPLTFVLLHEKKIDPPSELNLMRQDKVVKTLTSIHEKSYLGIKIGLSLTNIDNKLFKLNNNNELSVKTDSLKPNDIKFNLMGLVELYPFGRDYDRLKLVTDKDNIPIHERIGLVAGLKISKDPLESIFAGASFAVSKAFNIVGGISFNKTPKDIDNLEVGYNTTLDYLRRHADKEYLSKFYVGISVSPEALFKVLGIKN